MAKITITIETDDNFSPEHIFMGNDPARFAGMAHRAVHEMFMGDVLEQGVYHTGENKFIVTCKSENQGSFAVGNIQATKYNEWGTK